MLYCSQHAAQCGVAAFPCIINVWPPAMSSQASCLGPEADFSSVYSGCCPPEGCSSTTSSQAACGSAGLRCEKAEGRSMDCCGHVDPVDLTANLPDKSYGAGDANRPGSAATSTAQCQGKGYSQSVRRQKGGLSAALKATSGAIESYNGLWCHAAEKNSGGDPLPDAQLASGLVGQGFRPAAAKAHELAVAAAMERLNRDPPARVPASTRCAASKVTSHDTPELDDAGCMDGAPGSVSEAWDSLPFFAPSLVDRLWAGRSSHGSSSPRAPQLHLLHPQPASQQQHRQQFSHKTLCPDEKPQPCQCAYLQSQQIRNDSAPLSHDVELPSVNSTPTAASADANPILTTQVPSATGIEPRPAAAIAAQPSQTGLNALPAPLFLETVPPALRVPDAVDFGDGASGDHPDLVAVHMPCMALVAAAAATTAAPRALGAAAATTASSGESSRGLRAVGRGHSGSGGAASGGIKMPPSAIHCLPSKPFSVSANSAAAIASVAPAPPLDLAAAAPPFPTRTSSYAEPGDISNAGLSALPPPRQQSEGEGQQQQRQHDTVSATLVAMAMSAYDLPRGHVHNGPRMPLGTSTSPPATNSCLVRNRQQPAPSPLRLSRLGAGLIDSGGYSSTAEGDLLAAAVPPAAACAGGGNPWTDHHHEPDSPVSQASTEWEPRVVTSLTASAISLCRTCEGRNLSQVNLYDTEKPAMISMSDSRTQWWGQGLGGGRFDETANARLHDCGSDSGRVRPRHGGIIGGGGRKGGETGQRRTAWWRWLLPFP
ncbi:hypothetical protein Vretimale_10216 [Volvox reticuliferus]|uniref:Uncharacterized protein n=1 Tax=Volvox reticuliferus TaxID=1737510 RepID=A0A8J4GF30_9CHLO|nr:hypothetical protein Vretifemale_586 [Volvox reticuliferus]GIM05831.1 hypothetical protein Vretimale_10216 [Volvox reticuliferus]